MATAVTVPDPVVPATPAVTGGGGCSAAAGQQPFDPVLPVLAVLGLIGLVARRWRSGHHFSRNYFVPHTWSGMFCQHTKSASLQSPTMHKKFTQMKNSELLG
jgi:hypothetical protein